MKQKIISFFFFVIISTACTAKDITGYWEGIISHQQKNWNIAVEFVKENNTTLVYVDFIEIGGYRRLFSFSEQGDNIRFERQQPNGRPPLIFEGVKSGDSISGSFEGIGIKGAGFLIKPAIKPEFTSEDVLFKNDTMMLAGTLLIPKSSKKCPAVVITHGSGPDTRDVYYGIAMDFIKNGIAVLIYDKRGLGKSKGGNYNTAGITGLAKDALAGVRLLKTKAAINPKQIGVFGHSQGGWIAPMAATLSNDVAYVITSAASAVTATEQSVYHRMNIMRQEGFDENAIQKASGIRQRLNEATRLCYRDSMAAKEAIKKCAEEINTIKNEPWFAASALPEIPYPGCPAEGVLELLFKEPVTIWEKVKVPVYAVWGEKDIVLPVEKRYLIADALIKNGNKKVFMKLIANTDHSFLIIRQSSEWDFPREVPGYFSDMAKWINGLFL